jgi:ribonuclease P protein component
MVMNYGAMLKQFSFPKTKRLVSGRQFEAVLGRRLFASTGVLLLYMAENTCGYPRLGISVGKGCGGAVIRNRLKRILREAFRQSQGQIPQCFDYVLIVLSRRLKEFSSLEAKKNVKQLKPADVQKWLLILVNKITDKLKN